MQVAGAPAVVSLSIVPVAPFSTSCGEDPVSAGPTMVNALPQLVPPPEAQVRGSGSGSKRQR
ncbi:MAG: hypothetical protein R2867_26855 [Caldilineaceae bacterium]